MDRAGLGWCVGPVGEIREAPRGVLLVGGDVVRDSHHLNRGGSWGYTWSNRSLSRATVLKRGLLPPEAAHTHPHNEEHHLQRTHHPPMHRTVPLPPHTILSVRRVFQFAGEKPLLTKP